MAVDNRPFKSKEQDGQGNEVIIRDQQLVEQGTTTTMPAGTYFQTLDVDGRPVKIPKDNMLSLIVEGLGIIFNGQSDQQTVTKVPTLNGNNFGASTVATLASVLGAKAPFYMKHIEAVIDNNDSVEVPYSVLGGLLLLRYNNNGNVGMQTFPYNITFSSKTVVDGLSISRSTDGSNITISNTTGYSASVAYKVILP